MQSLHRGFTGSGASNVFEVQSHKQWVSAVLVNGGSSVGVYDLQFVDNNDGVLSWVTYTGATQLSIAGTPERDYHLPPGRYRFLPSTAESGAANIHVDGDVVEVGVDDPV